MIIIKDKKTAFKLHVKAREEMKLKLLSDIVIDMEICKLEGWDVLEYVKDLQSLLLNITNDNELQQYR